MMNILHLKPAEKELFKKLSKELQEGWSVEEESQSYEETPEKSNVRLRLLRVHDPKIASFMDAAEKKKDANDLAELVLDTDLSGVSEAEIAKLFFVLGPTPLGKIIEALMQTVSEDNDIKDIAAIATIRHELLSSLQISSK
ncbi:MAG: hypothetical protein K9M03_01565 [Kiritimatiellales bacterium]|nr:hypothetical protein [Kiritimatiellales bacterium]